MSEKTNQRILLRWKEGIEIYELPSWYSISKSLSAAVDEEEKGKVWSLIEAKNCKFHTISPNGTLVAMVIVGKGVIISKLCESGEQISLKGPTENVGIAYFSPLGTYVVTWERWNSNVHNSSKPNIKLWKTSDGEYVTGWGSKATPNRLLSQQMQQQTSVGQYSILQWTSDEELMMFGGGNSSIVVYKWKDDAFDTVLKIPCPNVRLFSISPKLPDGILKGYIIATFTPEVKGKPGRVSLQSLTRCPEWTCKEMVGKSFYQTEECNVHWSPLGDAMLCVTQMTVDKTGQSYYGSSNVYLFTTTKAIQVSLPNHKSDEVGMIHDIAWNPSCSHNPPTFALVSGKMPAMTSLHHGYTAQPIFLFGKNHRNTIVWAPHGRFVCFGGFGNLAGNFDFWDKNKGKRIPGQSHQIRGRSVPIGYTFSPDSRLFLISTTSPRMNVDNGIQLFRYNGDGPLSLPLFPKDRFLPDKLFYAEFVPPLHKDVYPDRPQTPRRESANNNDIDTAAPTPAPNTGRYVPPAMRNRSFKSNSNSLAERMRREREDDMGGPTKVTRNSSIPGASKTIPGLNPVKNNQKSSRRKKKQEPKKIIIPPPEPKPQLEKEASMDPEKRIKKIKKTLKQIEELKSSDKPMNEDQKRKIETHDDLTKELEQLEVAN